MPEKRKILHTYELEEFTSVIYEDQVLIERDPDTYSMWVTFNRPEKLNAGQIALWDWLSGFFPKVVDVDETVKTVVLRGAGPCFGVGGDAEELGYYIGYGTGQKGERRRPPQRRRYLADKETNFGARGFEQALHRCSKVVIVQAHGYCYGAHMQLAMLCDIVVASEDAQFTHPAFRYLGPFINVNALIENVGIKKFKEMTLTGRPLSAEEAERAGLVTRTVPRDQLDQTVRDYVKAVSLMPMDGIVMGKALIEQALEARGYGLSFVQACTGHGWITNLSFMPGEYIFLKDRRDKGLSESMDERDQKPPPAFRIGKGLGKKKKGKK